jgi:hypothetical protein
VAALDILSCGHHIHLSTVQGVGGVVKRTGLAAIVLAMLALHQDFWLWRAAEPLLFGFLPIGLAYHAAYTVAAAVLMWLLARLAWPAHLEREAEPNRD